jgi:hypothetical protein
MARRGNEEDRIQAAMVDWLHHQERLGRLLFFAVPNGGKMNPAAGARFKRLGTRAGVPDIVILFKGGRGLFVEVKTPVGVLSKVQRGWRDAVQEFGYAWRLVRSLDDLIAAVDAMTEDVEQRGRRVVAAAGMVS